MFNQAKSGKKGVQDEKTASAKALGWENTLEESRGQDVTDA